MLSLIAHPASHFPGSYKVILPPNLQVTLKALPYGAGSMIMCHHLFARCCSAPLGSYSDMVMN